MAGYYNTNINPASLPDRTATASTTEYIGDELFTPHRTTVSLAGHQIRWTNGFMSFECAVCEMEHEVPQLFAESGGSNSTLYQMLIFGMFKNEPCTGMDTENEYPGITKPYDPSDDAIWGGNVYWSDSPTFTGTTDSADLRKLSENFK